MPAPQFAAYQSSAFQYPVLAKLGEFTGFAAGVAVTLALRFSASGAAPCPQVRAMESSVEVIRFRSGTSRWSVRESARALTPCPLDDCTISSAGLVRARLRRRRRHISSKLD